MSFFNRFFKNNKFPAENNDGTIQIINNKYDVSIQDLTNNQLNFGQGHHNT
jgi:hypothetical protein